MNYQDWYTRYCETYKRDLKPKTRESYDHITRAYIMPVLGSVELNEITPEDIQQTLNNTQGERQAQIVYALIHATLRRAYRSRLISWNPCDAIDKPKHHQQPGKALTDDDYQLVAAPIRKDIALSLALWAGLRRGEILGLRWGDVDLRTETIHVRTAKLRISGRIVEQSTKSAAGTRDIPIVPELLPILRRSYQLNPQANIVKCAPETISRHWIKLQANAATTQHYRLHDLRHTYGTRLILGGCNIRVVQYLMGHASLEVTTRVYSHITPTDAKTELKRIASLER